MAYLSKLLFSSLLGTTFIIAFISVFLCASRPKQAITRYWLWFVAVISPLVFLVLSVPLSKFHYQLNFFPRQAAVAEGEASAGLSMQGTHSQPAELRVGDDGQAGNTPYHEQAGSILHSGKAGNTPYDVTNALPTQKRNAGILLANLVWLWSALAIAMFLRLAIGMRRLRGLRARSSPVEDAFAKETQEKLCKRLGIRRHVALLESEELSSPISLGLFSPAIILPRASLKTFSATELNAILAHELTHIKRWDYPVSLLQRMIGALMFFHPLYYLACRQLDKEREYITDAWVIKLTEQPLCYAKSLSHIAETTLSQPKFIGSLATVAYRGEVSKRVAMILRPQGLLRVSLSKKAAFVVCCLAGVLFAIASVITVAQNPGGDRMNILAANSTSDDQDSTPAAGAIRIPVDPEKRFGRGYPVDLAYSPDGKYLAIATSVGINSPVRTRRRPPPVIRLPRNVPLSRLKGATPTNAAICLLLHWPSSGSSVTNIIAVTSPMPGTDFKISDLYFSSGILSM